MLRNQNSFLERIESCLAHVESHIAFYFDSEDPINPLDSSARVPMTFSYSKNDYCSSWMDL